MIQQIPLGDIAEIESGITFPERLQGVAVGDLPFAKVGDISRSVESGSRTISTARNFISTDIAKELRAKPFPSGSIVFAKIGEAIRLNNRAVTTRPMLFDNNVMGIFANPHLVNVDYLQFFLETIDFYALTNTTAVPSLRKTELADIDVPLPPLEKQKEIAGLLHHADQLRRTRRYALQLCDELLPAAFLEMFGEAPAEWPMVAVEDIAVPRRNSIRTGPFGSQLLHSEFTQDGIAVLGIDNAVQNRFEWSERRFISPEKYKQLERYTVLPGDVIITIMGTCGRCAIVPNDIPTAINTKHLCCITLDQTKVLPSFLHAAFLHHPAIRHQLGVSQKGAIMDGLNMEIIKGLHLPLPPIQLQERFATIAAKLDQCRATEIEALRQADHLFQTLLHEAFRMD